jgi:flagella basal body P-ring formation protein FlgA
MKTFRSTLLAVSMLVIASSAYAEDGTSHLTGKTLISGDVVTVGDLFTNTGGSAQHVLAPAPVIGGNLALSASDLQRVVKTFRLNCKDKIDNGINLERDAIAIDNTKIVDALNNSDLKSRIETDAQIQITNLQDAVIIPGHQAPDLTVSDINFNKDNKKFSAVLNIMRDNKTLKQVTVEGMASVMIHVPVLKFAMTYDTAITENDIGEITIPQAQLRGDTIFNKEDLIGMTAKRTIPAGQIITQQDVTPPVLVKRNDLVTIIYKSGAVQLSAKARSLGNGSRGDNLQFMNMTSKKTFDAKVTGPQLAEVNLDS